jgi:hypothetical protein
MAGRSIQYEAAFEDYLRGRRIPFVPVNQARRVSLAGQDVKSFDFLVYPAEGPAWIADVKGRRFPYGRRPGALRYWENWVLQADIDSLAEWQLVFGPDFEARFVFAYLLEGPPDRWPAGCPHGFAGDSFAFLSITLEDYRKHCRCRSPRWETVTVPTRVFRRLVSPVQFTAGGVC